MPIRNFGFFWVVWLSLQPFSICVDTEQPEKLRQMFTVLFNEHHAISLTQQEKLKLGFYLLIEYIFYMSMLFGLARQYLLCVASSKAKQLVLWLCISQLYSLGQRIL